MSLSPELRLFPVALLFFGLIACSSRGRFDGVEYQDGAVHFRLGEGPSGFARVESNESLVSLSNDASHAAILVNARCHLDGDDVPLRALVQHLFLQFTERNLISETPLTLDGRAALRVELLATLDGVQRHFVVFVLKKDGCVYDLVHVDRGGTDPTLVESRQDFDRMARGFHTVP